MNTSPITRARHAALYNSPAMREHRAEQERGPDRSPIAEAKRQHLDEKNSLAAKHVEEDATLHRRQENERQHDPTYRSGGAASVGTGHRHEHERDEQQRRHERERDNQRRRHRIQLEGLYAGQTGAQH